LNKTDLVTSTEYKTLLLQQTPMIDLRAPVEFAKGALPFTVNLPFINNEERRLIGICYKKHGQQAAIELGHQLVNGDAKHARVKAWQQFLSQHPNAIMYCARGGLRSQLSQQWLKESGLDCARVDGGFKSLRAYLLEYLEKACAQQRFIVLSGMTGTGKTDILKTLPNSLDLEGHANHKGSSFGRPLNQQPMQINFEHSLILSLLNMRENNPGQHIILEDESRNIGGIHLPETLNMAMAASDIIVLEMPLEQRIEKLLQEYVVQRYADTLAHHKCINPENYQQRAEQAFSDYLTNSLQRLNKRLGSQRSKEIMALMKAAIKHQHADAFSSHQHWLHAITVDYYDPMYLYQLKKRKDRVVFKGNHSAIVHWLQQHNK